ncbi:annexin A8-like [Apodemus sylvaticus]|uniref:annexin A8-like n=1 Tax=Apodemus sylvaticus TaxID=10129 RepID=UPI002243819C|nr:annexin A8-like [Apodemus sylvaticus]
MFHSLALTPNKCSLGCKRPPYRCLLRAVQCWADESPSGVNEHSITCPGPKIKNTGEDVILQVSLNNGISFIGNKVIITSTNCMSTRPKDQSQPPPPQSEKVEQEGVSVKGSLHFNPDPDAETLYKAMKGIGTNEQAIIDVLTKRSNVQRQQIAKSFKAQFGKDLTETLKSELSGKFERLIVALMYPPYTYEAKELHDAMKGLGTKEGVIIEILASRTKNQLREIMKAYKEDYGSTLEEDIQGDTSGHMERILVCLLQVMRHRLQDSVA